MANAASLVLDIQTNNAKLKAGLNESKSAIDKFASSATKVLLSIGAALGAGFGIKKLVSELISTIGAIDDMNDSAQRLGVTIQEFQFLAYAAKLSGTSVEALGKSFGFMLNNIEKAADGTGEQADALRKLGLNASFLKSLAPEKQFERIATALSQINNQNEKVNLARTIFGRGAAEVIPLLSKNVAELRDKFKELNIELTDGQRDAAAAADDAADTLGTLFTGIKQQIAAEVAPAFTAVLQSITDGITGFSGLKLGILQTASAIITFSNYSIKGIELITDSVRVLISEFKLLSSIRAKASQSLGESLFNTFSGAGEKANKALEGVSNGNTQPFISDVDKNLNTAASSVVNAGRSLLDTTTSLDAISTKLDLQINQLKESSKNKSGTSNLSTGFGEITGSDGRTLSVGTRPANQVMEPQKVDVNISLDKGIVAEIISSDGRVKQYTREQIQEFMNDSARGQTN